MRVDELGTSLTATITQLDPVVDPQSQTISLRAALKNPKDVIAGMSGTALFDLPIAAQKAINPKR
jgi:multidrug efflux pump subunit AcrA (membrane-fusion protein)